MKRPLLIAAILAVSGSLYLSAQEAFVLSRDDLPGWKYMDAASYTDKELFGHINGGAELYMEYGFQELLAQRWVSDSAELNIEAYRMATKDGAFGVATLARGPEAYRTELRRWSWLAPGQLILAHGEWHVNVTITGAGKEDTATLNNAALGMLRRVRIQDGEAVAPSPFQRPELKDYESRLRFIIGPLGLQNAAPEWSDFFESIDVFRLYLADVEDEKGEFRYAVVSFPDAEKAATFAKKIGFGTAEKASKQWDSVADGKKRRALRLLFRTTAVVVEAECDLPRFRALLKKLPVI
jgi:hypothetical protein